MEGVEVTGIVKNGKVELPPTVRPPEGAAVRVSWEEEAVEPDRAPVERKPVRERDVQSDMAWALRKPPAK
jgi:hypothetical protein